MTNIPKNDKQAARIDFLECVKNHEIKVELDRGLHRCIKFSRPESSVYQFRLTTWPGYLAVSGDMGEYIFSRLPDMFGFFRSDELEINYSYWTEKLKSVSKFGGSKSRHGYEDFDGEATVEALLSTCADNDEKPDYNKDSLENLKHASNEYEALEIMSNQMDIEEAYDYLRYKPTYHIIWILYAIVWGIQQYDKYKEDEKFSDIGL